MEERRRDAGTLASSETSGGSTASEPAMRRRAGALKRKANAVTGSNSSSTPSKRMMTREKAMLASFSPIHNGPLTRARQAPSNLASLAPAADGVKQELGNAAVEAGRDKPKEEEELNKAIREWEALEAKIESEFEAIRSRDSNAHVVPYHCGWFSWQEIHPLEEHSLPSFFNGKSDGRTPEVYMEIRNWIMRRFHSNPNMQIEVKDLTELEVGDSEAKEEVMEFLDFWGLINFHPFPPADSASAAVDDDEVEDKDSLVNSLFRFQAVEACPAPVHRPNLTAQAIPSRLFPESTFADDLLKQEGPAVEYHCNSCSADCSRKRYHCPKQADFDLCTECFNNGKFGSDMSSSDFILMEPAEVPGVGSGKWTDQENLLLLEGLELFKENWNEIAEHVATKTKAQCMLHFLQMPIEDAFLDQIDDKEPSSKNLPDLAASKDDKSVIKDAPESTVDKNGVNEVETLTSPKETPQSEDDNEGRISEEISKNEDASQEANEGKVHEKPAEPDTVNGITCKDEAGEIIALKALAEAFEDIGYSLTPETSISFADLGNPVMGLAAFLVRLTESDVATASVRTSLKCMDSSSPALWLATKHCFFLEDPPDNKKDSTGSEGADAMVNHHNAQKDEQPERSQKQKDTPTVSDGGEISNTDKSKDIQDLVSRQKQPGSLTGGSAKKPDTPKEKSTSLLDKSCGEELSREKDSERDVDRLSGENKEPCQDTCPQSEGDASQPTKAPTDVEMVDTVTSAKEPHVSFKKAQEEVQQVKENAKDVHVAAAGTSNGQQPVRSTSVATNGADEDPNKEGKKEKHLCEGTQDKHDIEKLKRAAITALSAAAVKAQHLAKQEEDQIRQLSISLIEKQLHKLEMKLAIFSEIENLTIRVREQLDRSRQRLYHERAQIIAARLGVPPTTSTSKASLPTNRIATNFANVVPRPPIGMAYPRPPIPRPTGPSVSHPPTTMTGSSVPLPPPGSDNISSV